MIDNMLSKLVDYRNKDLWEFCNSRMNIELSFNDMNEYGVHSEGDNHIIYIPTNNLNSASFSHELLHIYLLIHGIYIGGALQSEIKRLGIDHFFSHSLAEHVSNCLYHIKMLPLYLDLGYKKESFLTDFNINKFSIHEMELLKNNLISFNGSYQSKGIDFYIGKYFAAKACPNKSYDYSSGYILLDYLSSDLYNILENCLNEWNNFDYKTQDLLSIGYRDVIYGFVDELEKWSLGVSIE